MRGSDGFGAHAALCDATANSFDVFGVFRDQGDFTVLMIWDADDQYMHYSLRPLPDFAFNGVTLSFKVQYSGLQPFDSAKFSWIGWAQVQVIMEDGTTQNIPLFDNATLSSGSFGAASGTVTFTDPTVFDGAWLLINDQLMAYSAVSGDTKLTVAASLANSVNELDWSTFANANVAVVASVDGLGGLIIQYGRAGLVNAANGSTSVYWASGTKFQGLQSGDPIYIGANEGYIPQTIGTANALNYIVDHVVSPTELVLQTAYTGTVTTNLSYSAPMGGVDGNSLTVYILFGQAFDGGANATLSATPAQILPLTGGTSYSAVWEVSIDFDDYLSTAASGSSTPYTMRQAWFTFAPALADGEAYPPASANGVNWHVAFTDWTVTDPSTVTPQKCAGPGSVRIGSSDIWATFAGTWAQVAANNYYHGFAYVSSTSGSAITVKYSCGSVHDLYIGTELYIDRQIVSVSLDDDTATDFDAYLFVSAPVMARRIVRSSVAAGTDHVLTITLKGTHNADAVPAGGLYSFLFDFLEAAVPSDLPTPPINYAIPANTLAANAGSGDASISLSGAPSWAVRQFIQIDNEVLMVTGGSGTTSDVTRGYLQTAAASHSSGASVYTLFSYPAVSPALDYDTDQTYKNSPEFTMWQLQKLGFMGDLDFYVGVFYWPQKVRGTNAAFGQTTITFSGTFAYNDTITVTIGGTPYGKVVQYYDTLDTIAAHFAYYINSGSVGVWASASGATLTITVRSTGASYVYSITATTTSSGGSVTHPTSGTGIDSAGTEGDWIVNSAASPALNYPSIQFLTDLFGLCAAAGINCVAAFSLELVNPPDYPTSPISSPGVWSAAFSDGSKVLTSTDLSYNGNLLQSTQCAPMSALAAFQEALFTYVAGLQNTAGLTPWLQFGEFLWWFFSRLQNVSAGYVAYTTPISIGLASAHNFSTGDRVLVTGVEGMTSANGTWTITVTDATHFTLNGSVPNGAWVSGTGFVSGGGMAYYDADTTAAFTAAHSRSLFGFTCQDDDPTVNSGVDSAWLAARLKAHVDAIRAAVLASYSNAKFELLYPDDVNHASCIYAGVAAYLLGTVPYPQGGRLNNAVNCPSQWLDPSTSNLDRIKIEALSWGSQYTSLDLAKSSMGAFPLYPASKLAYLVPIFNGSCPYQAEYLFALGTLSFDEIQLWAWDHVVLMGWPVPLPVNPALATTS